jgi:hypothetical protein
MSPFEDIVQFLSHLGDAIANLALGVQRSVSRSYETFDYVAARRAKVALTKIHKYGTEFGVMQSFVPKRFVWYMNDPSAERWEEVKADLAKVLDNLPEIAQEASRADSGFVLQPMFKDYLVTMQDRKTVLSQLLAAPPPTSEADLAALEEIRILYLRLMENLESCQGGLSTYISKRFPGGNRYLDPEDIPDAKPDTRAIEYPDDFK